jgi:hypothetical protein
MIGSNIVASTEDGLDKLAKHARGVLVVLAVVQLAAAAILYFVGAMREPVELATTIVIGLVFVGLAMWARKDPLPAVSVGLGIWIAGQAMAVLIEPASLYNGLLVKVAILAMFWNGISTGRTYNEMKRSLAATRSGS